jgi:cleavage and polyadenylation specificity factor subunit 3
VRVLTVLVRMLFHYITRHISNVPQTRGWEKKIAEGPPCVVLASPGFMESGPSRELFELWAPDSRNGLIVTGYSVEGTLARVSRTISDLYIGTRISSVISCTYLAHNGYSVISFSILSRSRNMSLIYLKFRIS